MLLNHKGEVIDILAIMYQNQGADYLIQYICVK